MMHCVAKRLSMRTKLCIEENQIHVFQKVFGRLVLVLLETILEDRWGSGGVSRMVVAHSR